MEKFDCKCGKSFGSLPELQAHWNDPERKPGVPHYRLITSGSNPLEHDDYPPQPGVRNDREA